MSNIAEAANRDRENVKEALKKLDSLRKESEDEATPLLNLPNMTARLATRTRQAIDSIITWQSEMPSEPSSVILDTGQAGEEFDL